MPGFRPSAWNQLPNRTGSGAPVAARAVPLPLRKQSSKGSATETAAPWKVPRRTVRRVRLLFIAELRMVEFGSWCIHCRLRLGRRHAIKLGADGNAPHE